MWPKEGDDKSPEKVKAITNMVRAIFHANIIFEVRYTKWISNIVIVKKASYN